MLKLKRGRLLLIPAYCCARLDAFRASFSSPFRAEGDCSRSHQTYSCGRGILQFQSVSCDTNWLLAPVSGWYHSFRPESCDSSWLLAPASGWYHLFRPESCDSNWLLAPASGWYQFYSDWNHLIPVPNSRRYHLIPGGIHH